ncbi:MAG TPA: hypothetical protein ENG50_04480 [Candidatus Altiarchaeales archaeon]|nr:hypothetical protein [Candidatus Altiarchaeales archaeon]
MAIDQEIKEIKKKLEEHEKRLSRLESLLQTEQHTIKKEVSIREFILSKRPKNDIQKALAIGYYLENYKKFPSFNVKDLEKGFRDAKEKVPKNVGDKIQKNIEKGHMMEAGEKKNGLKAWVLTNSGEKYVENNFKRNK